MGMKLSRCGVGHFGGAHGVVAGGDLKGVSSSRIVEKETVAYPDQKAGTSGLRKKTRVFMQPNYVANFAQSVFDCLPRHEIEGGTLLVGGDGRYYGKEALREICAVAAGNGVGRVWIGQHGLASTPACSAIIREREKGICFGGFLLTASHNPGGLEEDFGIKFDTANGAPGQETLMDAVYEKSKLIRHVKRVELPLFPIDKIGIAHEIKGEFMVEVIDPIEDWMRVMHHCFDFTALRRLLSLPNFSFVYDAMHGVSGPYAKRLFLDELKAKSSCLMRVDPKPDFGGEHPDPNLTYAKGLVEKMCVFSPDAADESTPLFGAAGDGDCDRNMILGRGIFVTPSDSVALIALYAEKCIPFFFPSSAASSSAASAATNKASAAAPAIAAEEEGGGKKGAATAVAAAATGGGRGPLTGLARSMPTSCALDQVAAKLGKRLYETPTGWKYFATLMDGGRISICGEESFGTGSVHVREKDGLWAVLAWLSILAYRNGCGPYAPSSTSSQPLSIAGRQGSGAGEEERKKEEEDKKRKEKGGFVSVRQIVEEFWKEFGRVFYCRYDFERKDSDAAHRMMAALEETATKYGGETEQLLKSEAAAAVDKELLQLLPPEKMDIYNYTDPVDGQIAKNQGVRLFLHDGVRIIWRLSGTGSTGATIRIYMERLEKDKEKVRRETKDALQSVAAFALQFCRIKEFVGTDVPTVIT